MKLKIVLENSSGPLDETKPFTVLDETDAAEEIRTQLDLVDWALAAGDVIRIVEVEPS